MSTTPQHKAPSNHTDVNDSLPEFPEFTPLSLHHKHVLEAITDQFASFSDFNFISLFAWDTKGKIAASVLNENLVVRFTDYVTDDIFFSFIGNNKIEDTIAKLIDHSTKLGHQAHLSLIPEAVIDHLPTHAKDELEINEDRDNHDYILSVNDLVEFRTNKYRGKKNLYNRFMREYGEKYESRELDLKDSLVKYELMMVLQQWVATRQKNYADTRNEFIAIERYLEHGTHLGARAFGTYIDGKLVAFTLFEITKNNEAIIHFDKANVSFVGVFEHLKHNLAKHLASLQVENINYEQDLGIAGLRHAKESYRPVKFLKKYTISNKH